MRCSTRCSTRCKQIEQITIAFCVAMVAMAAQGVSAQGVSAQVPQYTVQSLLGGADQCVDIINDGSNDKLTLDKCGRYSGQHWNLESTAYVGYSVLRTDFTGADRCLGIVTDGKDALPRMTKCANSPDQFWSIEPAIDPRYARLRAMLRGPEKCLAMVDEDGGNRLAMAECSKSTTQLWQMAKSGFVPLHGFKVSRIDDTLQFDGDISHTSFLAIKDFLDNGVTTIIINSGGGDGEAGLSIAEEMAKREINLIVDKYCISSCANYLFVTAKKKSLRPGAFLGFHGGLTGGPPMVLEPADFPQFSPEQFAAVNLQMQALYERETHFFAKLGFDPVLLKISDDKTATKEIHRSFTVSSKGKVMGTFPFEKEQEAKSLYDELIKKNQDAYMATTLDNRSPTKLYFPSKSTLQKYGVKGIEDYPYPTNQKDLEIQAQAALELREVEALGDF
jgi:hypothetical protein